MLEKDLQEVIKKKFRIERGLKSVEPTVKLLAFTQISDTENLSEEQRQLLSDPRVIAGESARTCYSSKLFEPKDYLNKNHRQITDEVINSTRESGHLTTREHVNFTFGLSGVSRQLIWSLLHAHPHYNSDQQSQRYVEMRQGNYLVPDLAEKELAIYQTTIEDQMRAYHNLGEILSIPAEKEYFRIFSTRGKNPEKYRGEIKKKAQEVARYVLPVATHANLYHTISSLTLMRYARTCDQYDVPTEAKIVVAKMVENVVHEVGAGFLEEIPDPIALEDTLEFTALNTLKKDEVDLRKARKATEEFDIGLEGRTSRLIGYMTNGEQLLGMAVRNVLGISGEDLTNETAINLLLNSANNAQLGVVENVTKMFKLSRAMEAISYTFATKISHTADSQNQRHRMTPGARPVLVTHFTGEPDYITPALIDVTPEAKKIYVEIVERSFKAVNDLLKYGVSFEDASYLLPNATAIRLIEGGTLLNIHHKERMRLCLNAQEEIWRTAIEQADQIEKVHPEIGQWLAPPCTIRKNAGISPFCPEGIRFCGVKVWDLDRKDYFRLI